MSALELLAAMQKRGGVWLRMWTGQIQVHGVHHSLWYTGRDQCVHRSVVRAWVSHGWVTEPRGCVTTGKHAWRCYRLTEDGERALERLEELPQELADHRDELRA